MSITYDEINRKISELSIRLSSVLDIIIHDLKNSADSSDLPLYSVKSRIKDSASAYLKTKRKKYFDISKITDLAGIRLLCLFENDLIIVNDYLLKYLTDKNYDIKEIKIFNYDEIFTSKIISSINKYNINDGSLKTVEKPGYKSLHYTVVTNIAGSIITVEIQARTLLQDVWGELEHSLSYKKGSVHPHIKKSFELLARDLETSDKLMSHLRDIFTKEQLSDKFLTGSSTPRDYLGYEESILPEVFSTTLKADYIKYDNLAKSIKFRDKQSLCLNLAEFQSCYNALCSQLTILDNQDPKMLYWIEMEKAFFHFCNKEYDSAISIYKKLKYSNRDKYCIPFRLGEILFVNGDTSNALIEFDESIQIIRQLDSKDIRNVYVIKLLIALSYWMLGDEYTDISIENISKCKQIYEENEQYFAETNYSKSALYNNFLWYHLAKYVHTNEKSDYDTLIQVYEEVADTLSRSEPQSSNTIDTLAWFFYNKYLRTREQSDLVSALMFCNKVKNSPSYSTYNYLSLHVQMNHIKEIIGAAAEIGVLA